MRKTADWEDGRNGVCFRTAAASGGGKAARDGARAGAGVLRGGSLTVSLSSPAGMAALRSWGPQPLTAMVGRAASGYCSWKPDQTCVLSRPDDSAAQ